MIKQQIFVYTQGFVEPYWYPNPNIIELDLFSDEAIPLVLTADDFTNVAERDSSHSFSFDIPGTKNNNLFFKHIYNINAESTIFNPHTKTKVVVKEGSYNIFQGFLQLNEIVKVDNEISYNITIYDNVANLKAKLEDKIFRDLDFEELNHAFDEFNIKESWTNTGIWLQNPLPANSFAGPTTSPIQRTTVLKYPMVTWNAEATHTATTIDTTILMDWFRPFINLKYLLQNMLRDVGYSVQFNFNNPLEFDLLYADFNKGWSHNTTSLNNSFLVTNTVNLTYPGGGQPFEGDTISNAANVQGTNYYSTTTNKFTCLDTGDVYCDLKIDGNGPASNNINISFIKNGTIEFTQTIGVSGGFTFQIGHVFQNNFFGQVLEVQISPTFSSTIYNATDGSKSWNRWSFELGSGFINDTLIGYKGDTNQWSFFKDIITMFDFVIEATPLNPKHLVITPYKDWIASGSLKDWTDKIVDNNIKYKPISGLAKRTIFKFVEDEDDNITIAHEHPNEWRYSHDEIKNIEIFDNDIAEVATNEVAATYVAPAYNGNVWIPFVRAADYPINWQNKWRILYDNGIVTTAGTTMTAGLPGVFSSNSYLKFSTKMNTAPYVSYNFGVVHYDYSTAYLNSLYNIYWFKYMDELYHPDTRTAELLVYLTTEDIAKLQFNDVIMIRSRRFRVKTINYRANDISKLELITIKHL